MLPAILAGGLAFGWLLARWLEHRYDRRNPVSSEALLAKLETARTSRRSIEIRTAADSLPRVLDCILNHVDTGFGARQSRRLLRRILSHRHRGMRSALFPVRIDGIRCELDFQWTRDAENRIRLLILAVPKVIRAVKRQVRSQPPAISGRIPG
jgi:uncharacterized protein (DUF2236 family)